MRPLLYIANMRLPSEKAHAVHVMEMCAALAATGELDVTLLVPTRATDIVAPDLFSYYGVPPTFRVERCASFDAFTLPLPRRLAFAVHSLTFARSVRARIAAAPPDALILSRDLLSASLLARTGRRCLAFEVHDLPGPVSRRLLGRIPKLIVTNAAKRAFLTDALGIPADRVLLAPNGVDLARFVPSSAPGGKAIVLYAGSLLAWKGVETLARAAAKLPPEVHVRIVGGSGQDLERFRDFLRREGSAGGVEILPHRPHAEMPALLAEATVLVLPTSGAYAIGRTETSPIKAFEYLAADRPIVASDLPSTREILNEDTAILFAPDDAADCARAIREALALTPERRSRMAAARTASLADRTWTARAARVARFLAS